MVDSSEAMDLASSVFMGTIFVERIWVWRFLVDAGAIKMDS